MDKRNYYVNIENISKSGCTLRVYGGPCKLTFVDPKFFVSSTDYDTPPSHFTYPCTLKKSDSYSMPPIPIPNAQRKYRTLTIQVRNRKLFGKTYALSIPYQVGAEAVFTKL